MIKKIKVSGYRLLDGFEADLDALTVIIGANATGKSTLFDCLRLISGCMDFPLNALLGYRGGVWTLFNAAGDERNVSWELTFSKPTRGRFWSGFPLQDEPGYVYEVQLGVDAFGQPLPLYECLKRAQPYEGHAAPLKYLEATSTRSMIYDREQRRLVPFDQSTTHGAGTEGQLDAPERGAPGIERMQKQDIRLFLSHMRFFNEYPIPSYARSLLAMCAFYPGFEVTTNAPIRTKLSEIRPQTLLSYSGDNLGTVLHEILTRADYRDSAEVLREFVGLAYPSFDDLFAETAYGTAPQIVVRIHEKEMKRPMELWELSDGMLRFLCLATALLNPLPPPMVFIDEPETGLHPRLLPIVGDMIKTAAEQRQVIVTTHSPDLLNCFQLDNVAVMKREGNKAAWYRPGTRPSLREMLESVTGDTLGDLQRSGELEALAP